MIGWAIETLVATTVLLVLVLMFRLPVRRSFGSGVAYALWLLPVARLILPNLPGNWRLSRLIAPLARQAEQAPGVVVGVMNPVTLPPEVVRHATTASVAIGSHHGAIALVPPTVTVTAPGVAILLMGLWGCGAIAFLGYHAIAHVVFCRRLLRGSRVGPIVVRSGVRVIESTAAVTPLAFGIWRKYVVFPCDFAARYDEDERELALLHEIGHHQRGDLIANWIALAVLALHWFNPIAWRAFRAFRADQEMANDARVLAGRSTIDRHAYACAIVKAAHPGFGTVAATCHLNTVEDLKGRLKMLTTGRRSRLRLTLGGTAVAALLIAGLGVTASGTAASEHVRQRVERATGMRFTRLEPVAPTMPTTPMTPVTAMVPTTPETAVVAVAPMVATQADGETALPPPPAPPAAEAPPAPAMVTAQGHVIIDRVSDEGQMITDDVMRHMPDISSQDCPGDDAKQMVINSDEGGRKRMIICTNRIAAAAKNGAEMAANGAELERNAYRQAFSGLRASRASVTADARIDAEGRAEALQSIDESIKELEEDLAHAN